jgi:hypothetical protein
VQRDVCVAARGLSTAVPLLLLLLLRRRLLLWRSAPLWALARALWHTDCAAARQPARLGSLRGSAVCAARQRGARRLGRDSVGSDGVNAHARSACGRRTP